MAFLGIYKKPSKQLIWALKADPRRCLQFDGVLELWLGAYARALEPPLSKSRRVPGLDATSEDQRISQTLLALDAEEKLYAWAKMWLIQDSIRFGLNLPLTGLLLAKHIECVRPEAMLRPEHGVAITKFLLNGSLDSDMDDVLWKLVKQSDLLRDSASHTRDELLECFVQLSCRRLGASYAKVNRVLSELRAEDSRAKASLEAFRDAEERISGYFVAEAVRVIGIDNSLAKPGSSVRDTLVWFSSARTRKPSEKWNQQRKKLMRTVGEDNLARLSQWIRHRPSGKYFGEKPYRDELFSSLWKGASWFLGQEDGAAPA